MTSTPLSPPSDPREPGEPRDSDEARPLLRVAVPNKGSLSESAAQMLREAGYAQRSDPKELVLL